MPKLIVAKGGFRFLGGNDSYPRGGPLRRKKRKRKAKPGLTSPLPAELRAWRKRRRLSQSKAALILLMSVRTYQEWEQGRHLPRGFTYTAIRRVLRTS